MSGGREGRKERKGKREAEYLGISDVIPGGKERGGRKERRTLHPKKKERTRRG
jgi:hypothetical protein